MFVVGGDSHSPTGGAFGAYMFGIGATEMLGVLVTGEIWLKVPHTILIEWSGRFGDGIAAKDVMLFLCGRFGMDGGQYQAVEYAGSAIAALGMQERMTLANMTAEFGGQTGLIAPDAVTLDYLARAGVEEVDAAPWRTDDGAALLAHHRFDAGALAPQVAAPHSPANSRAVDEYRDTRVDTVYIGACTGAKLADLSMAARVLRGHRVASGVRLLVAPASLKDQEAARAEGTLGALLDAGGRAPAERLRRLRRLRRAAVRRERGRDLVHRAQLQGPHGCRVVAGVSRLALHGCGLGRDRSDHRPAGASLMSKRMGVRRQRRHRRARAGRST